MVEMLAEIASGSLQKGRIEMRHCHRPALLRVIEKERNQMRLSPRHQQRAALSDDPIRRYESDPFACRLRRQRSRARMLRVVGIQQRKEAARVPEPFTSQTLCGQCPGWKGHPWALRDVPETADRHWPEQARQAKHWIPPPAAKSPETHLPAARAAVSWARCALPHRARQLSQSLSHGNDGSSASFRQPLPATPP